MALNNTGFDSEKNMDSVFKSDGEAQLDFETMFDDEDDMIDTIAGLKEDGTPVTGPTVFDDLHNEDRDATAKDFKDTMSQPGGLNGAYNPEGTDKIDPDTDSVGTKKESDADKWIDNADANYQNGSADKCSGVADDGAVVTKSINSQIKEGTDPDAELDPESECGGSCKKEGAGCGGTCKKEGIDPDAELDPESECGGNCKKEGIDPDAELDPSNVEKDQLNSVDEEGDLIDYNKNPNPDEQERAGKEKSVTGGDSSYGGKECNCGKSDCPICGKNNDDQIRGGKKPTDGVMEGTDPDAELDPGEGDEPTDDNDIEEFMNIAEGSIDKDVQKIEKDGSEDDLDDDLLSDVDKAKSNGGKNLDYDYEDDELIDMVMGED